MGNITTFSIYNDGLDQIKANPIEFVDKVCEAASRNSQKEFGVGNFYNLVRCQGCRHADDTTIYIHTGNCVTEVNPFSQNTAKGKFKRKLLGILVKDTNLLIEKLTPEELYDCLIEDLGIIPKKKLPDELHNKILAQIIKNEVNDSIKQYLGKFQM